MRDPLLDDWDRLGRAGIDFGELGSSFGKTKFHNESRFDATGPNELLTVTQIHPEHS